MTLLTINGRNLHITGYLHWPFVGKQLKNIYFHLTTEAKNNKNLLYFCFIIPEIVISSEQSSSKTHLGESNG